MPATGSDMLHVAAGRAVYRALWVFTSLRGPGFLGSAWL
jgi:hypothetical protein